MPIKALICEMLGTFVIILFLLGAWAATGAAAGTAAQSPWLIAAVMGLSITVMTSAFGHICGGHFNPAVTIGLVAADRFDIAHAPAFIIAQLCGALLAAALVFLLVLSARRPAARYRQQASPPLPTPMFRVAV